MNLFFPINFQFSSLIFLFILHIELDILVLLL